MAQIIAPRPRYTHITLHPENDPDGIVLVHGHVRITGTPVDIFDLAFNPATRFGYNAIDYTDRVSEGGAITSVLVELNTFTQVELIEAAIAPIPYVNTEWTASVSSRLRLAQGCGIITLDGTARTHDGGQSAILRAWCQSGALRIPYTLSSTLNLATGQLDAAAFVVEVAAPASASSELALNIRVIGYKPTLWWVSGR